MDDGSIRESSRTCLPTMVKREKRQQHLRTFFARLSMLRRPRFERRCAVPTRAERARVVTPALSLLRSGLHRVELLGENLNAFWLNASLCAKKETKESKPSTSSFLQLSSGKFPRVCPEPVLVNLSSCFMRRGHKENDVFCTHLGHRAMRRSWDDDPPSHPGHHHRQRRRQKRERQQRSAKRAGCGTSCGTRGCWF